MLTNPTLMTDATVIISCPFQKLWESGLCACVFRSYPAMWPKTVQIPDGLAGPGLEVPSEHWECADASL